jgi:SAM-dependent methyltransferase
MKLPWGRRKNTGVIFENTGHCWCCDRDTRFVLQNVPPDTPEWQIYRRFYRCASCGSVPRERALMYCVEKFFPGWRGSVVHECSPSQRGASVKLRQQAKGYIPSQYYRDIKPGEWHKEARCENIESMTFEDESIDLHITQDVLEHVFHPARAFKEIARTLRPGGMHIFTAPLFNKDNPTEFCAKLDDEGDVVHLREPVYHGNPISEKGSLLTVRWGYDICDFIFKHSGLFTKIVYIDAPEFGIRADFIEVLITAKPRD